MPTATARNAPSIRTRGDAGRHCNGHGRIPRDAVWSYGRAAVLRRSEQYRNKSFGAVTLEQLQGNAHRGPIRCSEYQRAGNDRQWRTGPGTKVSGTRTPDPRICRRIAMRTHERRVRAREGTRLLAAGESDRAEAADDERGRPHAYAETSVGTISGHDGADGGARARRAERAACCRLQQRTRLSIRTPHTGRVYGS